MYQPPSGQQPSQPGWTPQQPGQSSSQPNWTPQQYPYNPQFTPPPQGGTFPPYGGPPQPPRKKRSRAWLWIAGIALLLVCSCAGLASLSSQSNTTATGAATSQNVTDTPTSTKHIVITQYTATPTHHAVTPTAQPTPTPTPQPSNYPPTTEADLHALAAKGDASAIHGFHSESVGLPVCPQPKLEVTVDPSITGQQLAEDLLAYFYAQQLDNVCGSVVFAYHSQAEANDVYTAGRVLFDVTDSSGQVNVDPNASGLTYKLTLDTGGILTGQQEYVVTY